MITSRHGNGAGRVRVLSPQFLTPTPQYISIPVPDTRRVQVYCLIPIRRVSFVYRVSPTPSHTSFKLEKYFFKKNIKNLILEKIN